MVFLTFPSNGIHHSVVRKKQTVAMRTALICFLFFLCACSKDKSCEDCVPSPIGTFGTVEYAGPVAADGCDWVIIINGSHYHPDELDPGYLHSSTEVELEYFTTGDIYRCGFANTGIPVIHITRIKRR
jgi:hypothetical protein